MTKAYLGIKFHPDNRNRETIDLISRALGAGGFETVCVQRDVERWGEVQLAPSDLMARTFEVIRSCQVVVIELSEKGVGLGIEAGYAHAQSIPVVTIARAGSDISSTLRGISRDVCLYRGPDDLQRFFASLSV